MSDAYHPVGNLITYEEAAAISGKHLSTVYRWVAGGHIRQIPNSNGDERLSEVDVRLMMRKKWTRRRKGLR